MAYTPDIQIEVNVATGKIKFTDATNFAGIGVVQADVRGNFTIRDPLGIVVHTNADFVVSPDLDGSVPRLDFEINIPTDVYGDPLWGTYQVEYESWEQNPSINTGTFSADFTFDFEDEDIGDISFVPDCSQANAVATDDTSYADLAADIALVTGGTNYPGVYGSVSRIMTIKYPPATNANDIVTAAQSYQTADLANGRYSVEIESTVTLTAGALTVIYLVEDTHNFDIDCATYIKIICKYLCAFDALVAKFQEECKLDPTSARKTLEAIVKVTAYYELVRSSAECGKDFTKYEAYLEAVLGDCNCCPDCTDDVPIWVPGSSTPVTGDVYIVAAGANISVSQSTGTAGQVIYTVALDPSISSTITANTAAIAVNAGTIAANSGSIAANAGTIAANTAAIGVNTGNISANAGAIAAAALTTALSGGNGKIKITNTGTLQWQIELDITTTTPALVGSGQILYGLEITTTADGVWNIDILNESEVPKQVGSGGAMDYIGGGLVAVPAFNAGVTAGTLGYGLALGRTWDEYMEVVGSAKLTSSGSATELIFNAPAGYRPTTDRFFPVTIRDNTAGVFYPGILQFLATGVVNLEMDATTAAAVSGNQIEFFIEQRIRLSV